MKKKKKMPRCGSPLGETLRDSEGKEEAHLNGKGKMGLKGVELLAPSPDKCAGERRGERKAGPLRRPARGDTERKGGGEGGIG